MALGSLQDRELNKFTEVSGKPAVDVNVVSSTESGGAYQTNNVEDGATIYVGKTKPNGTWLVEKFVQSTGVKSYANLSNNGSTTNYSTAWTNRATLTYGRFDEITGY
jgi:hypothetical protein